MQKLGRNDACHCGSGLKYKKCCLSEDEAGNIMRIAAPSGDSFPEQVDFHRYINEGLIWHNALYKQEALHMLSQLSGSYSDEEIAMCLGLWNDYSNVMQPTFRKIGVFAAAMEHWLAASIGMAIPASYFAEKYAVSPGMISQRSDQFHEFAVMRVEEQQQSKPPVPSPAREIGMKQELHTIEALFAGMEFANAEEANAYLNHRLGSSKAPISKRVKSAQAKAEAHLYAARSKPTASGRVQLALEALELFPDSPDAYNILAEDHASSLKEAMPEYIGLGDDNEAIAYAFLRFHLWENKPDLIKLLDK